ncbi:MAG: FAD-dependent oxidoreductase [Bacillus sp. (in: firmicutes)]
MSELNISKEFPESYWIDSVEQDHYLQASGNHAEVVIVGGGITGITLAYLLVQEGVKVALIEANRIMHGTTGHTTAKITAQHGLIYDQFINQIGLEKAKLYYEANNEALHFIRQTIRDHRLECEFSSQKAYVYTNSAAYFEKVSQEMHAYDRLGISGGLVEELPIPVPAKLAIAMNDQAQFHPLKYLQTLAKAIIEGGGVILENAPVVDVDKGDQPKVVLKDGREITGDQLVLASHYPFYDWRGVYFSRLHAERSYVVTARTKKPYAGGMYITAESPTRSIRYTPLGQGENLLLIGGESHKTGQGKDTSKHYEALDAFTKEHFDIEEISYRWSAQDLVTLDNIPYIGRLTANQENIYVATGYAKWGMTNGTAAARLLRDSILQKQNKYEELYTPGRFNASPSIKNFIVQNADVAQELVKGKLERPERKIEDLSDDEGAAITVNGKRAGCYKDCDGKFHVVDTTCTHLGCETKWNSGERTWDCPCHGSRFSYKGEVVEGPATEPLKRIDLE